MTLNTLEGAVKDPLRPTKEAIIDGIINSPKKEQGYSLSDLADPLPPHITTKEFARAIGSLNREGVLPARVTPIGPLYDYNHQKARDKHYV